MKTKKEIIAMIKQMMLDFGIAVEDLLENVENSPKVTPQFLDIQKIKGIPCIYLRYNDETKKHEWMCLEVPDGPMNWQKGREWCLSKGGDYGKISTLKFVSELVNKINNILEAHGYLLIVKNWHWSTESSTNNSWVLDMTHGNRGNANKIYGYYVRAVLETD